MRDQYTVLICDDNEAVHASLRYFLEERNLQTVSAFDGDEALAILKSRPVHLIILDIMLPGMSGIEVCRAIRQTSELPILFLSARSEEVDRILGLEMGGDDYVTKPFSSREVALRVSKMLERAYRGADERRERNLLTYCELSLDMDTLEAWVSGRKLETTPREVQFLGYLVGNAGKVLNREQMLKAVWSYDYCGDVRAVDAAIKRVRRKIGEDVSFEFQAVYGIGYRLCEKENR